MSIPAAQSEAAALLARLTGDETPVETHISAVFIGQGRALKLKKAIGLGFLDFTRLEDRERFCRCELELNAPAAPALYRAVHKLSRAPDGTLSLGGDGPAEEWVLEMAALPPGDFLDRIAERGELGPALQDALADAVAALHATLPPIQGWDSAGAIARVVAGNITAAHASGLPDARSNAWAARAQADIARLAPALQARAAAGRIRRCHGDLHLGNLVLWHGRPVPFDALEFDEALATIDTGYDLAFLLADLHMRVGRAAANRVLNRYIARTGDAGLVAALPLWLSTRALIRAHVSQRAAGTGMPWLDAAEQWLAHPPARILAIGGLPGCGKSHLSRALAPGLGAAPGALVLRSDEIRKRRAGVPPEQRLPETAYRAEESAAVHAELFAAAEAAARAGHSVIADAAFLDPAMRAGIAAAAQRAGVPFQGLWLEAPLDLLRRRVAARTGDASDADIAVLDRAAEADTGVIDWARIDAAGDAAAASRRLLAL
ncbi:AAA family ATPase [Roseomonas aerophila]|uniref:AAA family ATPase n=1 Tax=Teichococcus aerophilus TaxID=1224513 RepID=A0ABR7RLU1_9PROT|nr:AAA family ATPase [Pseudoroseomonas aerophila]